MDPLPADGTGAASSRAVLVVAHPSASDAWTTPLEAAGYTAVVHDRADSHTYRWIRDERPVAILIDTAAQSALPLLDTLRRYPWAAALPIVTAPTAAAPDVVEATLGLA